jgi:hypothetical protein
MSNGNSKIVGMPAIYNTDEHTLCDYDENIIFDNSGGDYDLKEEQQIVNLLMALPKMIDYLSATEEGKFFLKTMCGIDKENPDAPSFFYQP